jgi:CBS domain-containing protein
LRKSFFGGVRMMFDRPVKSVMKRRSMLKAAPQTTVAKAARLMARRNVGAVMVVDGERLTGIFTERDLVRVVARGLDLDATPIADVMTASPETIGPKESFGYALLIMHERGFRHLPVLDAGKLVGVLSARSAMDPDLEEFVSEQTRRAYYLRERAAAAAENH